MDYSGLMDIADYELLTGFELTEEQTARYIVANDRAQRELESILGWNFNYSPTYDELARANTECLCPDILSVQAYLNGTNVEGLLPPTAAVGQYKLFRWDSADVNHMIDPALTIHGLGLARIVSGDEEGFVTVKTFQPAEYSVRPNNSLRVQRTSLINWIELCATYPNCGCRSCDGCMMLVVDADWLRRVPDDLNYFVADLITLFMRNQPSLEPISEYEIKSESVDGHSVSYGERRTLASQIAELIKNNQDLLQQYIGPYSRLARRIKVT